MAEAQVSHAQDENSLGGTGGPRFSPPLYKQRYSAVLEVARKLRPNKVEKRSQQLDCTCMLYLCHVTGGGLRVCWMQATEVAEEGGVYRGVGGSGPWPCASYNALWPGATTHYRLSSPQTTPTPHGSLTGYHSLALPTPTMAQRVSKESPAGHCLKLHISCSVKRRVMAGGHKIHIPWLF